MSWNRLEVPGLAMGLVVMGEAGGASKQFVDTQTTPPVKQTDFRRCTDGDRGTFWHGNCGVRKKCTYAYVRFAHIYKNSYYFSSG
jgi:hypothetical protein